MPRLFGTQFREEKGYDLRFFRCAKSRAIERHKIGGANAWAWRLVGKMRWDGSYRSFIIMN